VTLRTAGLIAGVLGLLLLAVALVATWIKPAAEASPSAAIDAAVVVVPPEVLALSPDAVLTVSGSGDLAAHTARTQDVAAWSLGRTSVTIGGLASWDALAVTTHDAPAPTASASPSAAPSTSPAATPAASSSPSPSAEPSAQPGTQLAPYTSDIWRDTVEHDGTYTVNTADVPPGLTLVVESVGGTDIDSASITMPRTIDDDWIGQVLWWGVGLTLVGLIALIALFIDVRPAQSRGEEWLAHRSAIGSGKQAPKPGSRRARREAGHTMPVATIPAEPTPTGAVPVVETPATPSEPVPMIPVAPRTPTTGQNPVVPASAFEPPQPDDHETPEEDRS